MSPKGLLNHPKERQASYQLSLFQPPLLLPSVVLRPKSTRPTKHSRVLLTLTISHLAGNPELSDGQMKETELLPLRS